VDAYSTSNTAVIGASEIVKLLIVCCTPSSKIRKLSFFSDEMNCPSFVVTITGTSTKGTFTWME